MTEYGSAYYFPQQQAIHSAYETECEKQYDSVYEMAYVMLCD